MSCGDLRASISKCLDKALKVREDLGLQKADVFFITRTWNGERVGDNGFSDQTTKVSPIPEIVDLSHDIRVQQGGSYKQGDLILKGFSRNAYPQEQTFRTDTGIKNVEKFIKVGDHFYRTIHIKENLVTWDVHVRKVSQDETERR